MHLSRKSLRFFLVLLLLSFSVLTLFAGSGYLDYVTDAAGLLTEEEWRELEALAEDVSLRSECDVVIVTVEGLQGLPVEEYAQWIYDEFELGYDLDGSGILLLVDMEGREFDLLAHGFGNTAFTDYGKEQLENTFLPYLSEGSYYLAFEAYILTCDAYLSQARAGDPVDWYPPSDGSYTETPGGRSSSPLAGMALAILPLLISLSTVFSFRSRMKSSGILHRADHYISSGGLNLTGQADTFLHRNLVRKVRVKKEDSTRSASSGRSFGGGTTINSRGSSHRSGKF